MPSLDNMMLRQIIMDHYENPRNHELVEDDSYKKVNMDSETCIDNIDIQAKIEDGVIKDIRFDGEASYYPKKASKKSSPFLHTSIN